MVMSGRSVTLITLPLTDLDLLRGKPIFHAHTFASNLQLPFLNQRKEKRKYVVGSGIELGPLALDALPTALCALAQV